MCRVETSVNVWNAVRSGCDCDKEVSDMWRWDGMRYENLKCMACKCTSVLSLRVSC